MVLNKDTVDRSQTIGVHYQSTVRLFANDLMSFSINPMFFKNIKMLFKTPRVFCSELNLLHFTFTLSRFATYILKNSLLQ